MRLSFDEEMWHRGVTTLSAPRELMVEIEHDVRERLRELIAEGQDVVLQRLRARANQHADDLVLAEQLASEHFDSFEPPMANEGPLTVITV